MVAGRLSVMQGTSAEMPQGAFASRALCDPTAAQGVDGLPEGDLMRVACAAHDLPKQEGVPLSIR
jgi:hypothetical protein